MILDHQKNDDRDKKKSDVGGFPRSRNDTRRNRPHADDAGHRASAQEPERSHAAPPGPSPRSRRVGFPRAHTRPPWSRTRPQNGSRRNPNSDGSGRPRDGGGGERGEKEGARLEAGAAPLDGGVSAAAMMRRFSGCAGGRWIREHPGEGGRQPGLAGCGVRRRVDGQVLRCRWTQGCEMESLQTRAARIY